MRSSILGIIVTATLQVSNDARSPTSNAITKKKADVVSLVLYDFWEADDAIHNTRRNPTKCHGTPNVFFLSAVVVT